MKYSELCRLTINEEPKKSGESKRSQLARIRKLYDIEEIDNGRGKAKEYSIVRKIPEEEIEANETYYNLVYSSLLKIFDNLDCDSVQMTNAELLRMIGFIRRDYIVTKNNIEVINEIYPMRDGETENLKYFMDNSYKMVKDTLNKQLKRLQDEMYIKVEPIYMLCTYTDSSRKTFVQHRANDKEISDIILPSQHKTLELYGYNNYSELPKNLKFSFDARASKIIREDKSNPYDFYYKAKNIILNKTDIKKKIEKSKNLINEKTVNRLKNSELFKNLEYLQDFIDFLIDLNVESTVAQDIEEYKNNKKRS